MSVHSLAVVRVRLVCTLVCARARGGQPKAPTENPESFCRGDSVTALPVEQGITTCMLSALAGRLSRSRCLSFWRTTSHPTFHFNPPTCIAYLHSLYGLPNVVSPRDSPNI